MAGFIAFVAMLELLFRLLPVSTATYTGYYVAPDILTYPPHHEWRVATGWDLRNPQTLRSNDHGFLAARDFHRNPQAVALIGDSYMEAAMLDEADRPGSQLERALGGSRPVYALACPGTALLDYAERVRFASERFGIRDFVIFLEERDVEQALCGSGNVHSACLDSSTLSRRNEHLPDASTAKRVLRHSALAQYIAGQLKVEPRRLASEAFVRQTPQPAAAAPAAVTDPAHGTAADLRAEQVAEAVAGEFLRIIGTRASGRIVLIADTNRSRVQAGLPVHAPSRARFMALARDAGLVVVDMDPRYRDHFRLSSLSLSVGPYDGHLNPLGVSLVSQAAAQALGAAAR